MLDFLLVLCSHRGVMPETIGCIERMKRSKLVFYTAVYAGDALLSRNRSIACSHFVENDWSPYMIFLDDDIIFENRHLERIHQDLTEGYDIVGGCYAVRDGTQLASYGWDGLMDGKVKEVEYLATGFMGISRKALMKIRDDLKLPLLNPNDWAKCWPFFECGRKTDRKGDPIYISEDWDFCEKAREAGIKTYLDTSVQLGHLGLKKYTVQDVVDRQVTDNEKQKGLMEQDNLIELLAEFLHEDKAVIIQHFKENPSNKIGELFKESGLSLMDFYKKGNSWLLYDLAVFNCSDEYKTRKLPAAEGLGIKKVLDFGCGIGTASIFMAKEANKVYGYDVCQKMIDFCNFRKDKLGLVNVEFSTILPEEDFDTIMAIDVFEHIPNLKEVLIDLGKRVKSGTRLCHMDSFKHDIPVHIDHKEHIDEWLEEAGFVKYDAFRAIKK